MSFVVAIAGGSASGKSTLAEALANELAQSAFRVRRPGAADGSPRTVEIIPMDRYMRRDDPSAPQFFFHFSGKEMFDFNRPDSTDNVAARAAVDASKADIVLLEGLMPLAIPELRDRADLRVFVDLDADVRAIRRMERDVRTGRGGGDPAFIAAYYIECARVGHARYVEPSKAFADIIVRGDADFAHTAHLLARLIRL